MSTPSHLDWCGDPDCGDVSHKHAADAVRGSELRRRADAAMALLANVDAVIDVPKRPEPHGWDIARLERIEAILRANWMHEGTCGYFQDREAMLCSPDPGSPVYTKCDCWLAPSPKQDPAA